jgi:hypothetical protein
MGDGKETACLMSMRTLLDGRPFSDQHPSATLRMIGFKINDGPWWTDDEERTRILLPLAQDERLCALKCKTTPEVERKRGEMCSHWALSWAAPFALEQAALVLEPWSPEHAVVLRAHSEKLRMEPTRQTAQVAVADAYTAYTVAIEAAASADRSGKDVSTYIATAASAAAYTATYAVDTCGAYDSAYAAASSAFSAATVSPFAHATDESTGRKQVRDSLIGLFVRLLDVGDEIKTET